MRRTHLSTRMQRDDLNTARGMAWGLVFGLLAWLIAANVFWMLLIHWGWRPR